MMGANWNRVGKYDDGDGGDGELEALLLYRNETKRNERLVPDFIYKLDSRTRSALRLRVTSYDSVSVSDSAAASASDYSGCFEF